MYVVEGNNMLLTKHLIKEIVITLCLLIVGILGVNLFRYHGNTEGVIGLVICILSYSAAALRWKS